MKLICLVAIIALVDFVAQAQLALNWEKTVNSNGDTWNYSDELCTIHAEINYSAKTVILKWHQELKEIWSFNIAKKAIGELDTMYTNKPLRLNPQGEISLINCEFNPGRISIFAGGPAPADVKDPYYRMMIPSEVLNALKKLAKKIPDATIKKMLRSPLSFKTITSSNFSTIYK